MEIYKYRKKEKNQYFHHIGIIEAAFHETSSRNGRKKKILEKGELTLDNEEEIILIELENQIKKLTKKKVAGEDEVKNKV